MPSPPSLPVSAARVARRRRLNTLRLPSTPHPETRQVRHGSVARLDGGLVIRLPKPLESPNLWLWTHWRTKHAAKAAWAAALRLAVVDTIGGRPGVPLRMLGDGPVAQAIGWVPPPGRVIVTIERRCHSSRQFIRDRDNRLFSGKALVDCLVGAGFLRADDETAIDLEVLQAVSDDGGDWTVVTLTPELDPEDLEHEDPIRDGWVGKDGRP